MALACVSASVCFDLYGVNIASTGTEKHVVLRVLVCLILSAVLAASREPGFVDWMQVRDSSSTSRRALQDQSRGVNDVNPRGVKGFV